MFTCFDPQSYRSCRQYCWRRKCIAKRIIYIVQMPLDSALVLNKLCQYRHKSYGAFIFVWSIIRQSSTTLTLFNPKFTEFGQITQNIGRYAVPGHSRSPTFVPIESPHATSYKLTVTYILYRTISKLLHIIGQICAFCRVYLPHPFGVNP